MIALEKKTEKEELEGLWCMTHGIIYNLPAFGIVRLRFKHKLIFVMDGSNPEKLTVLITESKFLEVSISAF